MGIESEFARYGAKLRNRNWAVSALIEDPTQLIVSVWAHNLKTVDGRWVYEDSLSRWQGAGKNLLKEHLAMAHQSSLPLRPVVATMHNRDQVLAGTAKSPRNTFKARPDWSGRVERLDGDDFVLVFEQAANAGEAVDGLIVCVERVVIRLETAVVDEVIDWFSDDRERSGSHGGRTIDRTHLVDVLFPEVEIRVEISAARTRHGRDFHESR